MNVTPLHTDWLPTAAAAERLGVTRRTLQRWASAGRIAHRTGGDGRTMYAAPATPPPATCDTPTPATRRTASPPATPATSDAPAPVAELLALVRDAMRDAARAELERERLAADLRTEQARCTELLAELERTRATAGDLAARLVRRGELLRAALRR